MFRSPSPNTTTDAAGLLRLFAIALAVAATAALVLVLSTPDVAFADVDAEVILAKKKAKGLDDVIADLQKWIMGILGAVATLFLVLAGVYYTTAGGDPAQVDKAKGALKNALVGYGLAVLAPVLLGIVKDIVGG